MAFTGFHVRVKGLIGKEWDPASWNRAVSVDESSGCFESLVNAPAQGKPPSPWLVLKTTCCPYRYPGKVLAQATLERSPHPERNGVLAKDVVGLG